MAAIHYVDDWSEPGVLTHGSLTGISNLTYYNATITITGRTAGSISSKIGSNGFDFIWGNGNGTFTGQLRSGTSNLSNLYNQPTFDFDGVVTNMTLNYNGGPEMISPNDPSQPWNGIDDQGDHWSYWGGWQWIQLDEIPSEISAGVRVTNVNSEVQIDSNYSNYVVVERGTIHEEPAGVHPDGSPEILWDQYGYDGFHYHPRLFTRTYQTTPILAVRPRTDGVQSPQIGSGLFSAVPLFRNIASIDTGNNAPICTGFYMYRTYLSHKHGFTFDYKVYYPAEAAVSEGLINLSSEGEYGLEIKRVDGSTVFDSRIEYMQIVDTIRTPIWHYINETFPSALYYNEPRQHVVTGTHGQPNTYPFYVYNSMYGAEVGIPENRDGDELFFPFGPVVYTIQPSLMSVLGCGNEYGANFWGDEPDCNYAEQIFDGNGDVQVSPTEWVNFAFHGPMQGYSAWGTEPEDVPDIAGSDILVLAANPKDISVEYQQYELRIDITQSYPLGWFKFENFGGGDFLVFNITINDGPVTELAFVTGAPLNFDSSDFAHRTGNPQWTQVPADSDSYYVNVDFYGGYDMDDIINNADRIGIHRYSSPGTEVNAFFTANFTAIN